MKLSLIPLLVVVAGAFLGRRAEGLESVQDQQQECIAPSALHECMDGYQRSQQEAFSKLEQQKRALEEDWLQKLNSAVASAVKEQTTKSEQAHKQQLQSLEEEWLQKLNTAVSKALTEQTTKSEQAHKQQLQSLEDEWLQKLNTAVSKALTEQTTKSEQAHKQQLQSLEEEWIQKLNTAVSKALTEQTTKSEQAHKQQLEELDLEWKQKLKTWQGTYQAQISSLQKELEEYRSKYDSALDSHDKKLKFLQQELESERDEAVADALREERMKHNNVYDKLKRAKKLVEDELITLRSQVVDLQHSYHRTSNDLLEARQGLLKANEIVRLYNLKFYNRWLLVPLKNGATEFYETILTPLGKELYLLGQPVLDPLHGQVWQPVVLPVVQPVAELLLEQTQAALRVAADVLELAGHHLSTTWENLCEQTVVVLTAALEAVRPHVSRLANTIFQESLKGYKAASAWYQDKVQPALQPLLDQMAKFYADKVLPFWNETVVKDFWKGMVIPRWQISKPIIVNKAKSLYGTILFHWTHAAKNAHKLAVSKNMPPAIQDVTKFMSENPEKALLTAATWLTILVTVLVLRWIFGFGKVAKKAKKGPKNAKSPHKAANVVNTKKAGVQFSTPPATPSANGKKANKPQRRMTPFPKKTTDARS